MERSKLAQLRAKKRWSQQHAAVRLEVSAVTLNRWEKGLQKPYSYNLQKLGDVYGVPLDELGFDVEYNAPLSCTSPTPLLRAFLAGDLSMRLLTLAFTPHRTFAEVQAKVSLILEEFDAMNTDPMTRREALKMLAVLSVLPLYPAHPESTDATLHQCAASIAACNELGRGKDIADLAVAFEGASAALEKLEPIVKDSSRHRKAAATLASQAAQLQMVFGRHLQGPEATIQYGKQAVLYGKQSGEISEYLEALVTLAWSYYHIPQCSMQALQTMEQAVSILKEQRAKVPLSMHGRIYSVQAVMQAKNGLSATFALKEAAKNAFADQGYRMFTDDPVNTLIMNEARASYHQGEHGSALNNLSQLIDIESKDNKGNLLLTPKRAMSEKEYLGTLSDMTQLSLKTKDKDLERSVFLWKTWTQRVKALKSELYFGKVLLTYENMDTLWGDDSRMKDLRPLAVHW